VGASAGGWSGGTVRKPSDGINDRIPQKKPTWPSDVDGDGGGDAHNPKYLVGVLVMAISNVTL